MTWRRVGNLVRYLHGIAGREGGGLTDGELLARYVARRDEAAFELLLWRHGTLVHNVCRRVLHAETDAEDAFQATFLTFIRKAHTIRGGCVGGWLHKVAYRVALEARARAAKTARREQSGVESLPGPTADDPVWSDLRPILDEELSRLPERLRGPLVLCYLEGKTNEEAARQLGCPPGTIYSRLARGRELLRSRLLRRGVPLSAGVLTAVVCTNAAAAAPGPTLVTSTFEAALLFAAGKAAGRVPAPVAALAEGVLQTMHWTRIKLAALAVLLLGLLTTGGALTLHALRAEDPPGKSAADKPKAAGAPAKAVVVRVVKPVPGGLESSAWQTGTVQPFARQRVHATVPGFLKEQLVDIGDWVKKGQLLAVIDAPLLAIDLDQARTVLELAKGEVEEVQAKILTAQAEVKAAEAGVAVRKANVETATATLSYKNSGLQRSKDLAAKKLIDQGVVDKAEMEVKAARAAVASAEASIQSALADVMVSKGKLRQAQALLVKTKGQVRLAMIAVEKARAHLNLTRLTAAYDGVVTSRLYSVGDYIPANETAGRQPLLSIARVDRMRVVVAVAEADVPQTEVGASAEVTLGQFPPGVKLTGKVSRIAFGEDEKTRTMKAEIDLPNPTGRLRPGMSAVATIHLKPLPGALTVPWSALRRPRKDGEEPMVYVVRDGKAHRTPVRVGTVADPKMEILSGLKPTDLVITNPKGVTDGAAVKVRDEP